MWYCCVKNRIFLVLIVIFSYYEVLLEEVVEVGVVCVGVEFFVGVLKD